MKSVNKCVGIVLLLFVGLMLSGCTPEKAGALSNAAVQFKVKSLEAVGAILLLMDKELESPPRTNSEINEEFVKKILELEDGTLITSYAVKTAIDPYSAPLDKEILREQEKFKNKLRKHYIAFADIFEDLEGGSFFAKKAVKASAPHAKKLTLQMAALAKSISSNPPILVQYRNAITVEIENVLEDKELKEGEKKSRLIALKEKWDLILAKELDLQRSTVEKCLEASLLGMQVCRLIDKYDTLSLDDIHFMVNMVINEAGAISGKDLSNLKLKSENIFAKIESDPIWKGMTDVALEEANNAMANSSVSDASVASENANTDPINPEGTNAGNEASSISAASGSHD